MKTWLAVVFAVATVAGAASIARADVSKQARVSAKLPASERVFVLDKEAPATDKTAQLPRSRPALKQKL